MKEQLTTAKKELKEHLERAQQLRDFIAVTEKLCGKRSSASAQMLAEVALMPQKRRTKTAVLAAQVVEVLKAAGHAMHVKDIIAKLAERGQPVTAQNPVATVAVALTRRKDQFTKVSPNTFELAKKEGTAVG